ncbi:hypothetical protein B0H19DRAFT_553119 [Mycena capillaripes]|nr:hypothetical protein B0H19DRAFT_553119 [Mycena capillaripes]
MFVSVELAQPLPTVQLRLTFGVCLSDDLEVFEFHSLGDLPDEYLPDIGPVIKEIALVTGQRCAEQREVSAYSGARSFSCHSEAE